MTTLDPDALAAELDVIEARLKNLRECDRTDLPVGKRAQFIRELNDLEASLQAVHASREWAGVVMTTTTVPAKGTHGFGSMPELADYDAATKMLRDASATIEDLRLRVERHLDKSSPTLADVGTLWSFIDRLKLYVDEFAHEVREHKEMLRQLNSRRLDLLFQRELS